MKSEINFQFFHLDNYEIILPELNLNQTVQIQWINTLGQNLQTIKTERLNRNQKVSIPETNESHLFLILQTDQDRSVHSIQLIK